MITSRTNDKVRYIEKLKQKSSFRKEEGFFVVEGIRMIREVPVHLRKELYVTEKALTDHPELKTWCDRVETVSESVMEKLADTRTPQGMAALVRIPEPERIETEDPLYLILDGLQDPGNTGTLIRTAEAVGAAAVLLGNNTADPYSPKVVRSTMGTIFRVPVRICDDLPLAIRELKAKGVAVYGTHLAGTDFFAADLTGPVAFLIGSEGRGLSEEAAAEADHLLRIPMEGEVESLNAAVSGSVVAYEAYRQKKCR